jgi:crotonobetainyl-CoA:carnitine CoA-transferase CaiB-like acyl-CoA transferase
MVRISVFGQDGPYAAPRSRPAGHRLGGLLHLTGYPDRPPVRPGVTSATTSPGVFAAQAATGCPLPARRASTGHGPRHRRPLYGSVLRVLEWTVAGYDKLGIVR